ncbi:hypothetical protein HY523_00765 [Candidatus Berkelbacteria bacterium]|nr:hypothetical protein [Candidatus Berkelbacteria bacterium]
MAEQVFGIRTIRITTKERPTDRFLTTQIREPSTGEDAGSQGRLCFLVEIHNPWFPNSKIGQTIINTIVREYRRAESASPLTNFEIALRKTNNVLAQITQTGETDWIGNLSSVIILLENNHIHLAQTGRAHAYLLRNDRFSTLTEGLDEEAQHHPLTTYTNITSGQLEEGDRLLIASADIAETFPASDIQHLLAEPEWHDVGRAAVRLLQTGRLRRVTMVAVEITGPSDHDARTIYLDQPMSTAWESMQRFFTKSIRPSILATGTQLTHHAERLHGWTRDWLIPRIIEWTKAGHQAVRRQGSSALNRSRPALEKIRSRLAERRQSLKRTTDQDEASSSVKVHRYDQRVAPKPAWKNPLAGQFKGIGPKIQRNLSGLWTALKKISPQKNLSRQQKILLLLAGIIVIGVTLSVRREHSIQQTVALEETASAALETAKNLQQQAERAFILGQKETAKNLFFQTVAAAKTARAVDPTAADQIIENSQTILDQLLEATRLDSYVGLTSAVDQPIAIERASTKTIIFADQSSSLIVEPDSSVASEASSFSLPTKIDGSLNCSNGESEIFCLTKNSLVRLDLTNQTSQAIRGPETWSSDQGSLERFGSNLYYLHQKDQQIWRATATDNTTTPPQAWLKATDPELATAVDLAIDGEIYVLLGNGSVRKYARGALITDWQLSGLPTPWETISQPRRIFTDETTNFVYIWEDATDQHPSRLISFTKDGVYDKQLLLPESTSLTALDFQPLNRSGAVLVDDTIGRFAWPE